MGQTCARRKDKMHDTRGWVYKSICCWVIYYIIVNKQKREIERDLLKRRCYMGSLKKVQDQTVHRLIKPVYTGVKFFRPVIDSKI